MSCFVNEDSFLHGVTSIEENCGKLQKGTVNKKHLLQLADLYSVVDSSASKRSIRRFVITEKAPTRAFSCLKAATTAFTLKTLLRHYAKRTLTPRSLNVKLGPRRNYHKGRAAIRHYANQPARPF